MQIFTNVLEFHPLPLCLLSSTQYTVHPLCVGGTPCLYVHVLLAEDVRHVVGTVVSAECGLYELNSERLSESHLSADVHNIDFCDAQVP